MNSGIYIIKNTITGKCYVGSTCDFSRREQTHFRDLREQNHSSIKLQRSYDLHGRDAFAFIRIYEVPYTKAIKEIENQFIQQLNAKKNGYNIADATFGDTLTEHPRRLEIIAKRSATLSNRLQSMSSEERAAKYGKNGATNGMFGKTRSAYEMASCFQARKDFIAAYGHGWTLGQKHTMETKKTLSELAKLRVGDKNGFYNRQHSEESKKLMSEKANGRECPTLRPVIIDGVRYTRLKDAEVATGIKSSTIWHRCSSSNKKFISFYFEDTPKATT